MRAGRGGETGRANRRWGGGEGHLVDGVDCGRMPRRHAKHPSPEALVDGLVGGAEDGSGEGARERDCLGRYVPLPR